MDHPSPIPTYLLQTRSRGRAGERIAVKRATLVDDGAHILRANRLNRTADLINMLAVVTIEVAIVVAEVSPLKFTHGELRSELEGSLTNILLRNETLEGFTSDDEHNFVWSRYPSWVAALSEAIRNSGADDRIDENEVARTIEASRTKRLLVDAEGETTITHELITTDALITELEATSGEIQEVFFDISIVTEVFDLISRSENLEELTIFAGERLRKHLFAEEGSEAIEGLEVHRRIGKDGGELGVDLLHITSEVSRERLGAVHHILDARLDQVLIADVSIDELKDRLFERNLSLEVRTLEGRASLLDANARTSTTEGLELELILSRSNLVGSSTNTAESGVIHEGRSGEGSSGNRHFLNNATDDIRDIRESSTINRVDVRRFASKHTTDLADDAVDIFTGEVLDCRQRNAGISHIISFLVLFCLLFYSTFIPIAFLLEENRVCLGFVLLELPSV